jgi:hypothetical protein
MSPGCTGEDWRRERNRNPTFSALAVVDPHSHRAEHPGGAHFLNKQRRERERSHGRPAETIARAPIAAAPSVIAAIAKAGAFARDANRYAINFLYNQ